MEKLTIELELTKEEMEALNSFIERKCLDVKKWYRRLLVGTVERDAIRNRKK